MIVRDLVAHLKSLDGGWVNKGPWAADTLKAGDPAADVTGIAVGWMAYTWALEKALDLRCNTFVTHEQTFYNERERHGDLWHLPGIAAKRELIEREKLNVYRCHDLWDQLPGVGIPDSWAGALGLAHPLVADGCFRVFDVSGRTGADVAGQVARACKPWGQGAVNFIGPPDKPVTRLVTGTGAITPFLRMVEAYEADMAVCADDGFNYWRDGGVATDCGIPVVVVHHHVAEEPGMVSLAGHLKGAFPDVPVHHIAQGPVYRPVHG